MQTRLMVPAILALAVCSSCDRADSRKAQRERREAFRALESLGYAAHADVPALPARENPVRVHDAKKAYQGLNYYTTGHGPKAYLIDMQGTILHEWHYALPTVVPDRCFWRRMYLYPNGDALAIFEGKGGGIARVDKNSKELWALSNNAHHDLEVLNDDRIFVLTREVTVIESIHPTLPVTEDAVTVLSADGEMLDRYSLIKAMMNSPWKSLVTYHCGGDIFHANTLEVLDGSHESRNPAFKSGNIMVSLHYLSATAILDPSREEIVWLYRGPWDGQHQPSLLTNGNILLLSNSVRTQGPSVIIEFDPLTKDIVWTYRGSPGEPKFYTWAAGSVARLPNGNTLASLSFQGRAVEITPKGEIVWEYKVPFSVRRNASAMPEMVRLPLSFPTEWATRSSWHQGKE